MAEVSCRAYLMLEAALRHRGVDPSVLTRGLSYSLEHLHDKHERIGWAAWCAITRNARSVCSLQDFEEIGRLFVTQSPAGRTVGVIARLLFSVRELYFWIHQSSGPGRQMFTCVTPTIVDSGKNRVCVELELAPGYEPSPEFFATTKGSLSQAPCLLGFPAARVELDISGRRATYDIEYPEGGGKLAWLRRLLTFPFTAHNAAREAKEAHEKLLERYAELEQARRRIQQQATQLETAYTVSRVIHQGLDLDRTIGTIVETLANVGGFARAELELHDDALRRRVAHGDRPPGEEGVPYKLHLRGRCVATLTIWPEPGADPNARAALLSYVVPTLELAIDDSLAFTEVADYRDNLERKVEQRTSELAARTGELEETLEQLRAAQAARERIFANISHEIRTPLLLINLAVGQVEERAGGALGEDGIRRLRTVQANTGRLLDLVDGLLVLAAGQEGGFELRKSPQELMALMADVVAAFEPAADKSGLRVEVTGSDRCVADVDRKAIERVVSNLIGNAIKFTPRGGRIGVEVEEHGGEVSVAVRDTGIGIEAGFEERIFERFAQGRAPVHAGTRGSGIGLAIVKELTEAHGGQVRVESPREGGTCFTITLPRGDPSRLAVVGDSTVDVAAQAARGVEASCGQAVTLVAESTAGAARSTVLLAEDEPGLREALTDVLRREHRVLSAPDGLTALSLAREHRPDLLVTDIGMPGLDGIGLTRRFRNLPGNRLAPVIITTAYGQLSNRLAGFAAGAVGLLVKPFHPEELLACVRSQLALRDLALRLHESEKVASLGVLTAGLAHELRNPANVVANVVRPLRRQLPGELTATDHPVARLLVCIEQSAEQISSLSHELLGLAPSGRVVCRDERLEDLVARALRTVGEALAGVTVQSDIPADLSAYCSRPLVVQVLVNLIENAADAAGPDGRLDVGANAEGDEICIRVSDSGPGVPPELREKIFDPFFTTKTPGQGTGLGLALARTYIERQGGKLRLLEVGGTTHFEVRLPARQEASVESPPDAQRVG